KIRARQGKHIALMHINTLMVDVLTLIAFFRKYSSDAITNLHFFIPDYKVDPFWYHGTCHDLQAMRASCQLFARNTGRLNVVDGELALSGPVNLCRDRNPIH